MELKKIWVILVLSTFILSLSVIHPNRSYAEDDPTDSMTSEMETVGDPMMPDGAFSIAEDAEPESPKSSGIDGENMEEKDNSVTIMSLLDIIKKGGIVGYLIIALSVISLGLIIDYIVTIRKAKILPQKDITEFNELIKDRNLEEIDTLDKDRDSFLAKVVIAGLRESQMGYQSMIKAMEDACEALTSGFARKIEHLNVIGNISPMMGLLGTVIGMLRCFNEIAHVAGAIEPKQLAGGIFEALITTCMGLIVAIPSLYAYAVFRNRIDEYTGEAALMAEQMITPFKSDPEKE